MLRKGPFGSSLRLQPEFDDPVDQHTKAYAAQSAAREAHALTAEIRRSAAMKVS
jgi:hypothetical protein